MAISGLGKFPNHQGWLWRGRSNLEPLIKTCVPWDKDVANNTMWNDWFFGQAPVSGTAALLVSWIEDDL